MKLFINTLISLFIIDLFKLFTSLDLILVGHICLQIDPFLLDFLIP